MTAFGASRPLPRVPAKVPSLNRQRTLTLGGGNASSCPKPVSRSVRSTARALFCAAELEAAVDAQMPEHFDLVAVIRFKG